jgi:hypothetical protein
MAHKVLHQVLSPGLPIRYPPPLPTTCFLFSLVISFIIQCYRLSLHGSWWRSILLVIASAYDTMKGSVDCNCSVRVLVFVVVAHPVVDRSKKPLVESKALVPSTKRNDDDRNRSNIG